MFILKYVSNYSHAFQYSCVQEIMLCKKNQDILISVDVFGTRKNILLCSSNLLLNQYTFVLHAYQTLFAFFTPFLNLTFIIKFGY